MVRLPWLSVVLLAALLAGCGGSHADKGPTVSVTSGHPKTTVPDVIGETSRQAASRLQAAGFHVRQRHRVVSRASQGGIVLSQNPTHSEPAHVGSIVKLTVGR
jgi:serine/threonine-protein kinase